MQFNSLLRAANIDPVKVSIILHLTQLEPLRSLLPVIVENHPDLFEAYQSVHSKQAAATLSNRPFAATFVPIGTNRMVFAGLFEITAKHDLPVETIYADPRFARLERDFGDSASAPAKNIARGGRQRQFTMAPRDELKAEIGRLQITAPGTRTYVQIAANLDPTVLALTEKAHFAPPIPHWTALILTKPEILNLPRDWQQAMRQWRGIYLITDTKDGARYVGSAYGQDNIIGRWTQHVAGDYGITAKLRAHKTSGFRFSILDLLRHDELDDQVIRREHSWMNRLHTRDFGLNT